MSTTSEKDDISKRGPLDNMSREELIKKCKGLLSIAQKAKYAKDEFGEQNKILRQEIIKHETQNSTDKESLNEMKNIVQLLTEQKLTDTIRIENYEKKLSEYDFMLEKFSGSNKLISQINNLTQKLEELNDIGMAQNSLLVLHQDTEEIKLLGNTLTESALKIKELIKANTLLNLNLKELVIEKCGTSESTIASKLQLTDNSQVLDSKELLILNLEQEKQDLNDVVATLKTSLENGCKTLAELTKSEKESKEKITNLEININEYKKLIEHKDEELIHINIEFQKTTDESQMKILKLEQTKLQLLNELNDIKEFLQLKTNEIAIQKNKLEVIEKELLDQEKTKQNNIIITKLYEDVKLSLDYLTKDYENMKVNYDNLKQRCNEKKDTEEQEKENSATDITRLHRKIKLYKTKLLEISIKLKQIKQLKCILLETIKDYSETIPKWQEKISHVSQQICVKLEQSDNENKKLKEALKEFDSVKNENKYLTELVDKKNITIENLRIYEQKFQLITIEYEKVLIDLEYKQCEIENLKDIVNMNKKEANDMKKNSEMIQILSKELDEVNIKLGNYGTENNNLLIEIKELSNILKERGEIISKQQSKILDLNQKLTNVTDSPNENKTIPNEKKQNVTQEDKAPIEFTTNKLNETLSTSTISPEDVLQMPEIEENYEEKYNKLRAFAIKLKKKITEQAAIINNQSNDTKIAGNTVDNELVNKSLNNLHKIQQENDKLQDEIDLLKNKSNSDVNLIKEINNKLEKTALVKNEYEIEMNDLRKELEAANIKRKELENQMICKEKENSNLIEMEKSLHIELEKNKNVGKQTNVLTLEMEAYEKSLNEINLKLESTSLHNKELKDAMEINDKTMESLKYQIGVLEDNLNSEKSHSNVLKQQIDLQQKQLKESDHAKSNMGKKINNLLNEIEMIKLELCDYRLQYSENVVEKNKIYDKLKGKHDNLLRQVIKLEENNHTIELLLKDKNNELLNAQTEFINYKIRAQSVLRQNQTKDTNENGLEDEILLLRSNIDKLNQRLNDYSDKLNTQVSECNEIKRDRERLQVKQNELNMLLDESQERIEKLLNDINKQNDDNQESLKAQQLYTETLINFYKNQKKEMEEKYTRDTDELKLRCIDKEKMFADVKHIDNVASTSIKDQHNEQKMNLVLMVREDGEGSESTNPESLYPNRKTSMMKVQRDFVPLDELLNSSMEDTPTSDVNTSALLETTKEKLNLQNNRVKHLTSLLAETEQDLAKLTQLNEVLKEEVRRQQRSLDREKHIQNSEYLKNVIIKFVTLNSGDEKLQLIPVLNTILKLSPDESQKLQIIAKGGDNFRRGWGSYLPIWSNNEP